MRKKNLNADKKNRRITAKLTSRLLNSVPQQKVSGIDEDSFFPSFRIIFRKTQNLMNIFIPNFSTTRALE